MPPYVVAALNGDVDNHADLRVAHDLRIAAPITTDAKVIPTLVSRHLDDRGRPRRGVPPDGQRVRGLGGDRHGECIATRARCSSRCAAAGRACTSASPTTATIVASEPYGVVEETSAYVRHGRRARWRDRRRVGATGRARSLVVQRLAYDGSDLPLTDDDVVTAEVTTRDINRGDVPALPAEGDLRGAAQLRQDAARQDRRTRRRLRRGGRRRRAATRHRGSPRRRIDHADPGDRPGHGGRRRAEHGRHPRRVDARPTRRRRRSPPPNCPGFGMRLDMSDTLAIAVSQSGTTTDTNRTVDLLRSRGAAVIGIVNRRGSDLTDKADGVLYTSDGRDVEMSVASTKAFYAQVAAGTLLSCAIAEATGLGDPARRSQLLADRCVTCPMRCATVLARRERSPRSPVVSHRRSGTGRSSATVRTRSPPRRSGSSSASSATSRSPATPPRTRSTSTCRPSRSSSCARPGSSGSTADDVAKEVAIFRAHKATPIVIANDGETRFPADVTIGVPAVDPALGFILSAMVGHLFGYEAALAIDASARPMREAREAIERLVGEGLSRRRGRRPAGRASCARPAERFHDGLRSGLYDGHLEASTATRLEWAAARHRCPTGRSSSTRSPRQGRYAAGPDRRSRRRADEGDRGAHPTDRHDQASGQDGHRRNLPQRRGHHRPAARAGGAGRRSGSRRHRATAR